MRRNRRAKIVATVGPASGSPDMLEALFMAGVDTFRLNFSHGVHADHAKVHASIRALEQKVGTLVWSPLGWGRLGGKVRRGQPLPATSRLPKTAAYGPPVSRQNRVRLAGCGTFGR